MVFIRRIVTIDVWFSKTHTTKNRGPTCFRKETRCAERVGG